MIYVYDDKKLEYKKVDIIYIYFLCVLIAVSMGILASKKTEVIIKKEKVYGELNVVLPNVGFSKESFRNYIKLCGIRFPDIVYAQAVLESANFSSDRFLEHNNAFGMKVARSRPTTASGEHTDHAEYDNWMLSVQDYALYQSAYLKDLRTENQYLSYLGQHYAEDKEYVEKIKTILTKIKTTK